MDHTHFLTRYMSLLPLSLCIFSSASSFKPQPVPKDWLQPHPTGMEHGLHCKVPSWSKVNHCLGLRGQIGYKGSCLLRDKAAVRAEHSEEVLLTITAAMDRCSHRPRNPGIKGTTAATILDNWIDLWKISSSVSILQHLYSLSSQNTFFLWWPQTTSSCIFFFLAPPSWFFPFHSDLKCCYSCISAAVVPSLSFGDCFHYQNFNSKCHLFVSELIFRFISRHDLDPQF